MSKKVDERVVEMRFDNRDFEANVRTSMSTLDKLKSALKLNGVSNGLKDIGSAAKKVDLSGLSNGIETVNARFSALQVVGMTALSNITSAAMRAGTNFVKSFTIDPVVSGFKEYELQMNSIQTILANTKSKGTTMAEVTAALDELNEYADLTIYNFAEMTRNIGMFTTAGVDLDTSVGAIRGIANLGAMSSSTASQVNSAMYQLSQALATGRVSLMDWNSVVNAGMGGEQFQNALKRTAENFGYDVDAMIAKYGSFRESLSQGGWLTAEVLNETLNQIGGAYDETALRAKGYSEDQIKAILDLADTATKAATEVKTFTQLMDTLKEAAGSGFAKMWQNIFGDFEQAKEFFSGLHEMLEPVITGPIDAMNSVIEGAMGGGESRWSEFTGQLDKAGVSMDKFQSKLSEVASGKGVSLDNLISEYGSLEAAIASGDISAEMIAQTLSELAASTDDATISTSELNRMLSEYQGVVDQVWRGDFGNVDTGRIERLTAAGWEFAEVQELVNRTVDGHRLTLDDLTAAQIVSMGYTQEQADALASLAEEAKKSGSSMDELINDILAPKRSGRELFLEGIENMLTAIIRPLQAVGAAFGDVFGMNAEGLYNLIEGFNEFSKAILISEDDADKLRRTLKGVFSVVHILATAAGKTLTVAFSVANEILGFFGTNVLEVTAFIGDAIYAFDRWITSGEVLSTAFDFLVSLFGSAIGPVRDFFSSFAELGPIQNAISVVSTFFQDAKNYINDFVETFTAKSPAEAVQKFVSDVKTWLSGLTWEGFLDGLRNFGSNVRKIFESLGQKFEEIGPDLIEGLQNGLSDGVEKVFDMMKEIGSKIIEAIKAVLGIQSPSTVMFEIGQNIVQGLINGISSLIDGAAGLFGGLGDKIKETLSGIDWGAVFVSAVAVGSFITLYKFTDALQGFATAAKNVTSPLAGLTGIFNAVRDGINQFTGNMAGGTKLQNIANAIKTFATALAILAGSVALLAALDWDDMLRGVVAIGALAAILGILAGVLQHFSKGTTALESLKLGTTFMSLGAALLMLSVAMRIIGGMDEYGLGAALASILVFGAVIAGLVAVTKFAGNDMDKTATFLSKVGVAFLLLAATAKIIGGMSDTEMDTAQQMLMTFAGIVTILVMLSSFAGNDMDKTATFLSKVGVAFLLLAATAKIIGGMSDTEMDTAQQMLMTFMGIVAVLIGITSFAGGQIDATADFLSKVGVAFLLLAATAKLMGGMSDDEMDTATRVLVRFSGIIALLVAITHLAPPGEMAKISAALLAMSISIGILAGISVLLGMVNEDNLWKGIKAVGALAVFVSMMALAARGTSNIQKSMLGLSVAIGVMAAALVILSFIDADKLISSTAALGTVMVLLAILVRQMNALKKVKLGPILGLSVAIAAIGAVLYILAGLPIGNVLGSAASLSIVLLSLAGACKIMDGIGGVSSSAMKAMVELVGIMALVGLVFGLLNAFGIEASVQSAIALGVALNAMAVACRVLENVNSVSSNALLAMAALTIIMAGLAEVMNIMSNVNPTSAIPNALALSVLLLAMTAAVNILQTVNKSAFMGVAAVAILTVVLAGIAGVLLLLSGMNPSSAIPNALALSVVLLAMTAAVAVLQFVGPQAAIGAATVAILTVVLAGIAGVLYLMQGMDPASALPNAQALSTVLLALSAATAILTVVGFAAPAAVAGAAALAGVIAILAGVVAAAGAIKQIPGAEWLIQEGGTFMEELGNALGKFVGGIAGGVLEGISDSLPAVADNLSAFMQHLEPFFAAASAIDPASMEAVKTLAEALLTLVQGGLLEQLSSAWSGESSLEEFGEQLVPFGEALAEFSAACAGIDSATIQAAAEAGRALAEMASALPKEGGLAAAIFGESPDMATFGQELVAFGKALVDFSTETGDIDTAKIQQTAQAAQSLVDVATAIGQLQEGGLIDLIVGEDMNFETFGTQLEAFGQSLVAYAGTVAGLDTASIAASVPAAQSLVGLAESINGLKEAGGGWFFSEDNEDLSTFGTKLEEFGTSLQEYSNLISGLLLDKMTSATGFVNGILDVATRLSEAGELLTTANTNMATVKKIGSAIDGYYQNIADVDMSAVSNSVSAIGDLVTNISAMAGLDTSGVDGFVTAIGKLATASFGDIVTTFTQGATQLVTAGIKLMGGLAAGMQQGMGQAISVASQCVSGLSTAVMPAAVAFLAVGTDCASNLATGLTLGSTLLVNPAAANMATEAANAASKNTDSFYNAGAAAARGFANGISSNSSFAVSAARSMAKRAASAAKAELDIHSPSKVFYGIGDFAGLGFVNALTDYQPISERAGSEMADSARRGLTDGIRKVASVLDSEMDTTPTIRPVLDLTDVRNGVGMLDSLMTGGQTLAIAGELGSISRSMNRRNQNGSFDDVVYAIDRLRGDLSEVGGNTYSINGITYDDGSNVAEAVASLVRATRIERRV